MRNSTQLLWKLVTILLLFALPLSACQPIAMPAEDVAQDVAEDVAEDDEAADASTEESEEEVASEEGGSDMPNILFLAIDDAGYSDLGSYGSEIPTPNLDTLAGSGLMFTDFHAAPSCSPTRSELLTGQDHHVAGFGNMGEDITEEQRGQPGYEGYLNERTLPIPELRTSSGQWLSYLHGRQMAPGQWRKYTCKQWF